MEITKNAFPIFSHNTLCLWVSFSASLSKHKANVENRKFSTPGGGEKVVVVVVIVARSSGRWLPRPCRRQAESRASQEAQGCCEGTLARCPFKGTGPNKKNHPPYNRNIAKT